MTTLSLDGIAKSFGSVDVLRGISMTFTPGEVTAIVGDNGAGKSTLMKIIAGHHTADSGRLLVNGEALEKACPSVHRAHGIEMVYQDLALARQQNTVTNLFMGREIVRGPFGLLNHKDMKSRSKDILAKLSIDIPDLDKAVGLLSGGQQQAIAIARAALFDPQILLLDEPTAALAEREVQHVLALIRLQREQGRTVILVSHRLNDVFAVADRIIVMKQGTVIADTPASTTSLPQIVEQIVR